MNIETFEENFHIFTEASNAIQKLREIVLQLAIRGKLVHPDPNDEPASDLIERIKAEKERLIEKGVFKRHKTLTPIDSETIPYALPVSWEWIRFGDIQFFVNGYTFKSSEYQKNGIGIVRIGDIQNGKIVTDKMKFVPSDSIDVLNSQLRVLTGDLVIAMSGATTGKLGFNKTSEIFLLNQRVGKINLIISNPMFAYLYLSTKIEENLKISAGSAIPNLSTAQINNILFPLPPLIEQKRIVAKVDQLMDLIDVFEVQQNNRDKKRVILNKSCLNALISEDRDSSEKAWLRINNNFKMLYDWPNNVNALRQSILQLAIQGRLVSQDPDDEPASALIEKIKTEKERLIKEGKIKRQKRMPPISLDEIPFELPNGWKWAQIREITHDLGQKVPDQLFTYIDVTAIDKEHGCISDKTQLLEAYQAPTRARKIVDVDSVIYSTVRPYLLNIAIIEKKIDPEPIVSTAFFILHPFSGIYNKYIFFYLRSQTFIAYVEDAMKGMAYPAINDAKMSVGLVPLPPFAEQKRIVDKVERLLDLCNELETNLKQSQSTSETLMETVVNDLTTL